MTLPPLHAGDILLSESYGLIGAWIRVKTWSDVSHAEVYIGNGRTFSSRFEGVNEYDFDPEGLRYVLRPYRRYNNEAAARWRATVCGQGYDWLGVTVFYYAALRSDPNRQICSEACTRDARHGGVEPFAPSYDADRVAPADFKKSPAYRLVWAAE